MNRLSLNLLALLLFLSSVMSASADAQTAAPRAGDRGNMRNARYCEVFVLRRSLKGPDAEVYNTLGFNDCPEAAWKRVDAAALKKSLKAAAVLTNGPRYFIMDKTSFQIPGKRATFDGLEMQLVAHIALPFGSITPWHVRKSYTETTMHRTTHWIYLAGRPIYELVAADGTVYVMQSYSRIVDPNLSQQDLAKLGPHLKLPAGWHYRTEVLKSTLDLATQDGVAHITQDNLENTYQRR